MNQDNEKANSVMSTCNKAEMFKMKVLVAGRLRGEVPREQLLVQSQQ